jgi:hypothetical protein
MRQRRVPNVRLALIRPLKLLLQRNPLLLASLLLVLVLPQPHIL